MVTTLELLTVEQVMALLQLSRHTVYRLAAEGDLPGRKIGRAWRFPRDELEQRIREGGPSLHRDPLPVLPQPNERRRCA